MSLVASEGDCSETCRSRNSPRLSEQLRFCIAHASAQVLTMGADCCATPEALAGAEHPHNMQNGASLLSNGSHNSHPSKGKQAAVVAKPHKDYVQKREPYYHKRVELFEQYYQREVDRVAEAKQAASPIKVTLPDGAVQQGVAGVTTPMDVAKTLPKSVVKKAVVAKVKAESADDAITWDLLRPLETDCSLELCTFDDKTGKDVSCTYADAPDHWHAHHLKGSLLV